MKRLLILCFLLGMMSAIFGDYVISRTITIDAATLAAMRSSSYPNNPSFDPFIDNLSESNSIFIHDDASADITRPEPDTITKMNDAVNSRLNGSLFDEVTDESNILSIVNDFLSYVPSDTVAALAYFRNTSEPADARALELTYYTINAAMLYDCLYYVPSSVVPDSEKTKLRNILLASIHLTMETIISYESLDSVAKIHWAWSIPRNYEYPAFCIIQYRFQMYGAMGLAALLLRETDPTLANEMNEHLDYVNNVLLNEHIPYNFPTEEQYQGMLAFHTTNSGAYFESLTYQGQVLQMICPFFTAYKRLSSGSVNYYNNQYIVSWINDLTRKGAPTGADWPYNDAWGGIAINPGPVFFFYNNSNNQEVRTKCAWYVKSKPTSSSYASYGDACRSYILVKYLSDPNVLPRLANVNIVPQTISQGSSSNSEYSILRKQISSNPTNAVTECKNAASMYILHENSFSPYHGQSDHLSYSFYYQGKPYLIDPGYRVTDIKLQLPSAAIAADLGHWNYGREWMRSIYAHNMIVVDPDETKELWELNKYYWGYGSYNEPGNGITGTYRPYSEFNNYNDTIVNVEDIVRDPCFRDYYQQSETLDMICSRVVYDDANTNTPISELRRSFMRYDDIFIIYDDIHSLDNNFHDFTNYYQFGSFNQALAPIVQTPYGFSINKGGVTVDMICGSTGAYTNQMDNSSTGYANWYLPTSSKFSSTSDSPDSINQYGHARGRTNVVDSGDTSLMTIIVPQDVTYPVTIQSTAYEPMTKYGAEILQNTRSEPIQPVSSFYGCTNGAQQNFTFGDKVLSTNGKMFALSILSNVQPFVLNKSIALLEGDNLLLNGTDLYRAFDTDLQGITATYENNELGVIIHDGTISYPRFKIYRNGVAPEQFSAIMRIQTDTNIPYPIPYPDDPDYRITATDIVRTLSCDDQYFYVNYPWDDLVQDGLVNGGNLTFLKGEIPEVTLTADLALQGEILVSGTITVDDTAILSINSVSRLDFDNSSAILTYGKLIIDGGESTCVLQSLETSEPWGGITAYPGSELTCQNAVIDNASTGFYIRALASLLATEVKNCSKGIIIETSKTCTIESCLVHDNGYGFVVSNNYSTNNLSSINANEICSNGIGIIFYNSNMRIKGNNIHNNLNAGLNLINGSDPLVRSNLVMYSENSNSSRPEVLLDSGSYPILDYGYNDINADGLGYSLCYNQGGILKKFLARSNYWGTTNSSLIRMSIYPPNWNVGIDPYCLEPNTDFLNVINNSFQQALATEEGGDLLLAKQLYTSIVVNEPDSLYALQSLGRLNSIYAKSDSLVTDLRSTYQTYLSACSDSVLVSGAQKKLVMLDRFDGQYQYAVQSYENLLYDSTTEMDSLLCLLDIAYTMQEMYYDDQGKGAVSNASYVANGLTISTLNEAKGAISSLWQRILTKTENSNEYNPPVPTKLEIGNFPNPFNPSTTVTFSLPLTSNVKLCVFNLRGQKVKDLICGEVPRGFHKVVWDGKDSNGSSIGSGIYFIRLESDGNSFVRKVMMVK